MTTRRRSSVSDHRLSCHALIAPLPLHSHHLFCTGIDWCSGTLKLQKERDNAKERKKEKKREKKERKEKSQEHLENSKHAEHNHNKRKYDERGQLTGEDDRCSKTAKLEIEQLEKSGLTVEFGRPSSILNCPDSSDSTQDSSSRRKLVTPDVCHTNNGLVLRIKLPLQKHDDVGGPSSSVQPSISGIKLPLLKHDNVGGLSSSARISDWAIQFQPPQKCRNPQSQLCNPGPSAASEVCCFSGRVVEELLVKQEHKPPEPSMSDEQWPCSSPGMVSVADGTQTHRREHKSSRSRSEVVQRQFRELIVDWKPCQLQFEDPNIGDQDWLSGTKELCAARRCGASSAELPDYGSSMNPVQTRACYLPEFDMHALPYMIPF